MQSGLSNIQEKLQDVINQFHTMVTHFKNQSIQINNDNNINDNNDNDDLDHTSQTTITSFPSFHFTAWKERTQQLEYKLTETKLAIDRTINDFQTKLQNARSVAGLKAAAAADAVGDVAAKVGVTYHFFSFYYLSRLGAATLFLFICTYLASFSSIIGSFRAPNVRFFDFNGTTILPLRTLPDLGHELLPDLSSGLVPGLESFNIDWEELNNILMTIWSLLTLGVAFLQPRRLMIFRRVFIVFGFLNSLRAITLALTVLPDSQSKCYGQFGHPNGYYKLGSIFPNIWYGAWKLVSRPFEVFTCGDMMFSGHAVTWFVGMHIWSEYFRPHHLKLMGARFQIVIWSIRKLMYIFAIMSLLLIIATRLHYTIDVVVSFFLTETVWFYYHEWVKPGGFKDKNVILRWMEAEDIIKIDEEGHDACKHYKWE